MDVLTLLMTTADQPLAVVPVLIGPMQALLAILPAILVALGGMIVTLFKPSSLWRLLQLLWSQKVIVVLIAGAIWGSVLLWGVVFPAQLDDVAKDVGDKREWLLLRGGATRRGFVPGVEEEPAHGYVQWRFADGSINFFYSSPAVVGNRVYATSAWVGPFDRQGDGSICCIDADSGKLDWKFDGSGYRATFSSPAISDKYLVVGEGLHETYDARVFCLDLEESKKKRKGVKLWEYRTKNHVESSPCIAEGMAFIGAGADGMYAFHLEPKGSPEKQLAWHLKGDRYPDCETSPVYHDGKVYFGLGLGGNAVVCVEAKTGEELWRIKTPYPVFSSPSISDGKLYVGMGNGDFIFMAEQLDKPPAGEVWCVNLKDHSVAWKFKAGRTVLGSVAIDNDNGLIYFGSRDKFFYCVSTGGELIRKWNARSAIVTSPAVGKDRVYVVTNAGQVYGLDKEKLRPVWNASLGSTAISSPALANGHIYVGTDTDGLKCVGLPGFEKLPPIWCGELGGAGRSGWADGTVMPRETDVVWEYDTPLPESGEATDMPPTVTAPVAPIIGKTDTTLYVGMSQGRRNVLAQIPCGVDLTKKPLMGWQVETANPISLSAVATSRHVYAVDGKPGDQKRALRCVSIDSGDVLWESPVESQASGDMTMVRLRVRDNAINETVSRRYLYVNDRAGGLSAFDITEPEKLDKRWSRDVGQIVGAPAVSDGIVFVSVTSPEAVLALATGNGGELWRRPLPKAVTTGPVHIEGTLWVGTEDGLRAMRVLDGRMSSVLTFGKTTGRLVTNGDQLVCSLADGGLIVITLEVNEDSEGQKALILAGWDKITKASPDVPPLLTTDGLLFVTADQIRRYDIPQVSNTKSAGLDIWTSAGGSEDLKDIFLNKGKSKRVAWYYPSTRGKMTTPMVMVNSNLLFATEKKGLLCMKKLK
jgi:outer membrane protein assembly factor BamB